MRYAADLGLLSPRLNIIHAIWVDDADLDLIAASGAVIAHNPISNLRLGSGVMPFRRIRDRGIPICLGTDEAIADDAVNMWGVAKTAGLVHNITDPDYSAWPTRDRGAGLPVPGRRPGHGPAGQPWRGRARAGWPTCVLLDLDTLAFTPLNDLRRQLVYCENGGSVLATMVAGRIVYRGTATSPRWTNAPSGPRRARCSANAQGALAAAARRGGGAAALLPGNVPKSGSTGRRHEPLGGGDEPRVRCCRRTGVTVIRRSPPPSLSLAERRGSCSLCRARHRGICVRRRTDGGYPAERLAARHGQYLLARLRQPRRRLPPAGPAGEPRHPAGDPAEQRGLRPRPRSGAGRPRGRGGDRRARPQQLRHAGDDGARRRRRAICATVADAHRAAGGRAATRVVEPVAGAQSRDARSAGGGRVFPTCSTCGWTISRSG